MGARTDVLLLDAAAPAASANPPDQLVTDPLATAFGMRLLKDQNRTAGPRRLRHFHRRRPLLARQILAAHQAWPPNPSQPVLADSKVDFHLLKSRASPAVKPLSAKEPN